ncbi:hypothetical protein D3C87_2093290 [compost metagenome]
MGMRIGRNCCSTAGEVARASTLMRPLASVSSCATRGGDIASPSCRISNGPKACVDFSSAVRKISQS